MDSAASSRKASSNCAIDCRIRMARGRLPASWSPGALRGGSRGGRLLGRLVVDLDEAQVVAGDLLGRLLALDVAVQVALQGVPPDRASDGEAGVALDRRPLAQPVVDLLVAGA